MIETNSRRASIGIYMPFTSPNRGGPDLTAMWLVQALCLAHDVTLITTRQFELDYFNRFTGTTLASADFRIQRVPSLPTPRNAPMSALQGPLFHRLAARYAKNFDLNISAMNPIDFGVEAVHFLSDLNWLGASVTPPAGSLPPEHRSFLRRVYHNLCLALYKRSGRDVPRQDVLVSNSQWVASSLREFGIDSPIISPPVPLNAHPVEWEKKLPDFVWIGRITPSKRLETAINIVGKLREAGFTSKIHVVGNAIDKAYDLQVREFARRKGDWVIFEGPLYGAEKAKFLAQFRFAIHTQVNEAFGITLVELLKSGCILFGPDSCGGAEILNHQDLLFNDEEEAASKILRVIRDSRRIELLRDHLRERANGYSSDTFCNSVRGLVGKILREKFDQSSSQDSPIVAGVGVL